MAQILNVSVYQREAKTLFNFDFGTDITGYLLYFRAKTEIGGSTTVEKIVSVHTNAAGGLTSISLTEDDTNIPVGDYYYEVVYCIEGTDGVGLPYVATRVTLLSGMFSILPSAIGEIVLT